MSRIIDGKPPRRSRFGLYLFIPVLVGVMIGGSRAMMLMERDALWIGKTRVFPPWYHKTIRLSETVTPEATSWVDFTVGTNEDFRLQAYRESGQSRNWSTGGMRQPPPPRFPPQVRDNVRQAFIFSGTKRDRRGGTNGHNCSGDPARDFGFRVKPVLGFYLVTADPQFASEMTNVRR